MATIRWCPIFPNGTVTNPWSLRQGFLKLITAEGHVLTNPEISLQAAGVQEEEHLTVVAQQTKATHTGQAFALWCSGGNQGGCLGQSRMSRKFRPQTKHLPQSQLMGQWFLGTIQARWWWLLRSSRSAPQRATNSGHRMCICSDIGWWIRGCLGQSRPWWWLLCSSRSAQERATNSGHTFRICSDLGRWITGCLGRSRQWTVRFKLTSRRHPRINEAEFRN